MEMASFLNGQNNNATSGSNNVGHHHLHHQSPPSHHHHHHHHHQHHIQQNHVQTPQHQEVCTVNGPVVETTLPNSLLPPAPMPIEQPIWERLSKVWYRAYPVLYLFFFTFNDDQSEEELNDPRIGTALIFRWVVA